MYKLAKWKEKIVCLNHLPLLFLQAKCLDGFCEGRAELEIQLAFVKYTETSFCQPQSSKFDLAITPCDHGPPETKDFTKEPTEKNQHVLTVGKARDVMHFNQTFRSYFDLITKLRDHRTLTNSMNFLCVAATI